MNTLHAGSQTSRSSFLRTLAIGTALALTALAAPAGASAATAPGLDLDRDITITVDARAAKPVDVRPPDRSATFLHSGLFVKVTHDGTERLLNRIDATPRLRVAHLGPAAEPGSVKQWFDAYWTIGDVDYALGHTVAGSRVLTGLVKHPAPQDLATPRVEGTGEPATATVGITPSPGPTVGLTRGLPVPGTATFRVTPERGTWDVSYGANGGIKVVEGNTLRAGRTTTLTFPTNG
ncbi:hypothetical protein [Streptomyces sp. NPDC001948]